MRAEHGKKQPNWARVTCKKYAKRNIFYNQAAVTSNGGNGFCTSRTIARKILLRIKNTTRL